MTRTKKYWTGARKAPAQNRFFIDALDPGLWRKGDASDWDACWATGMPSPGVFKSVKPGVTINHIPGNNALTVKSMLYQTLSRARDLAPTPAMRDRLSFFPMTYLMPSDYRALQSEAFHNPHKKWIIKPKRSSRGRGISVEEDAGDVPLSTKWLVQDYLSNPHLYDGRKYVLRLYVLITGVEPLRVYLYRDGFVKLASEPYREGDYDNLYAHLTNPDVNALNEDAAEPVIFHSFETYGGKLTAEGRDPEALFREVRDIAVLTAIAARANMRERAIASGAFVPGCYELIGLDCMVDSNLKPWLLECNLSPSLEVCAAPESGGDYETATKRALVSDLVSLLNLNDPEAKALDIDDEIAMLAFAGEEASRAGRFEKIYPAGDADVFLPYFPIPRLADITLARTTTKKPLADLTLEPCGAHEIIADDGLALFTTQTGRLLTPDAAASFLWLNATQGESPDAIANSLINLTGKGKISDKQAHALRKDIWGSLADWGHDGFLRPKMQGAEGVETTPRRSAGASPGQDTISWRGELIELRFGAEEIPPRIEHVIAALRVKTGEASRCISFLPEISGYGLADGSHLLRSGLKLTEVADALTAMLLGAYDDQKTLCLDAAFCEIDQEAAVLFAGSMAGGWDALALSFAALTGAPLRGRATALSGIPGKATPIALPMRVAAEKTTASAGTSPLAPTGHIQRWNKGRGFFVPCTEQGAEVQSKTITAIFIPKRDGSHKDNARIELLNERDGFAALNAMRRHSGGAFSHQMVESFFAWRQSVSIYEINFSIPTEAAHACAARIAPDFRQNE